MAKNRRGRTGPRGLHGRISLVISALVPLFLRTWTHAGLEITDRSNLVDAACACCRMILEQAKKWRTEALTRRDLLVLELLVHFGALAASLS
jgi:hypothetical protein